MIDVFFFQAEDGIRDLYVTGVQTCALPIWSGPPTTDARCTSVNSAATLAPTPGRAPGFTPSFATCSMNSRSEERRVGKERRSGWRRAHQKKTDRTWQQTRRLATNHESRTSL